MSDADLVANPCQRLCRWRATARTRAGERLFACQSCGSEWVRSQPWAPVDADGTRDPDLLDELARRSH